jgi:trehalose utilization protein
LSDVSNSNGGPIRVTVWGENLHEQQHEAVRKVYPDGMHEAIAAGIRENLGASAVVGTATLDQPEHGLTEAVLAETDVLTWWGHMGHHLVDDAVVQRVQDRVLSGMGLIVLHSGHWSKVFVKLMGTTCALRYREANEREVVWNVHPGHPITEGVGPCIVIPEQEMYGEYFDVPPPDELIFISSFAGGEVFRSGLTYTRGQGRIFYFSPGHETHPVYFQPEIRKVIANGVKWAYQGGRARYATTTCIHSPFGWFESKKEGE